MSLQQVLRQKVWLLFVAEWLALLQGGSAACGFCIYVVCYHRSGPIYVKESAVGMWLCCLVVFFAAQASLEVRRSGLVWGKKTKLAIHGYCSIASATTFICYALGGNADGWIWAVALLSTVLLNACLIHDGDKKQVTHHEQEDVEPGKPSSAQPPGKLATCCCRLLLWWNACNLLIAILFLGLLVAGAWQQAAIATLPVRGNFAKYKLADGRWQQVFFNCEGPTGKGGTFIIDSSISHGAADFWPLQRALTASGRRSCIFDKPGVGFSDYFYADQSFKAVDYYAPMLSAFGEPKPFSFIAWGGAAASAYAYALQNPPHISKLVFMDSYGEGVEARLMMAQEPTLTDDELTFKRKMDLVGRFTLFSIIRGLAVPWGLMPIFVAGDPSGYAWSDRFAEYQYHYKVAKTWTTQYFYLRTMEDEGYFTTALNDWGVFNSTVPAEVRGLPILSIMTNRSKEATCSPKEPSVADLTSAECIKRIAAARMLYEESHSLANLTGNPHYYGCSHDLCDLGFPLRFPEVVVEALDAYDW